MPLNRRSFLRRSGLMAVGAVAAPAIVRSAEDVAFNPGDKPRRIIHLVADGMSMATLTCADHLSHLERQRGLSWIDLYRRPEVATGLMDVRSLNSLVTDSSASSSAWGSGSRIVNGAVNMLPDGRDLTTLYQLFGNAGWKLGLVTTTEITHATPSGFAINMKSRSSGDKIAEQHLERGLEVLLGGGTKYFDAKRRKDQRDLQGEFSKKGYAVMTDKAALAAAPTDKSWLGTFSDSHLPFTIDQINIERLKEKVPTLPEMTRAALGRLEREERFILQVEGGRVDQAAHLNDAPAAFRDLVVFDEALDVCLDFQKRHPDTLLVVTTDHSTGNPGLNGAGGGYSLSVPLFHNLAKVRGSQELMLRRIQSLGEIGDEDFDYLEGSEKKPELVERGHHLRDFQLSPIQSADGTPAPVPCREGRRALRPDQQRHVPARTDDGELRRGWVDLAQPHLRLCAHRRGRARCGAVPGLLAERGRLPPLHPAGRNRIQEPGASVDGRDRTQRRTGRAVS
jgi:alkaline phosphatase